jgi:histidine triad (HIT) family protein
MPSIFTRIVQGEIPCHKIAEDDRHLAFLDIRPIAKGHTLVVPKNEVDYLFDLSDDDYLALHLFAKRVALAIGRTVPCVRVGVSVLGLEVPHAHIHLVPLDARGIIDFRHKVELGPDEMAALAQQIAARFE